MKNEKQQVLKILICEEDKRILQRLEFWIKAMGEEVYSTSDAIEASHIFDDNKPDILLVSQNIQNMGSLEFIELIKKKIPSQAIILMLNSEENTSIFKRSIDLQVDKYLNMPVDATRLFSAIEALSQEKIWHEEFRVQKRLLQDYKDAIDLSFSVSKHDIDGKIFFVNDLFCTDTRVGYEKAMQGVINPLENPNEDMDVVWDALHSDNIYRDRQVFKIQGQKDRIIDITAVALFDDKNEIYEYLVFSNDVSEIIYSARKIKDQDIDQRIQKIEHSKALNKIKDSFLTVFSHELKTPLNSIINFSEHIKKHLLKVEFAKRDSLVEQIQRINESGWSMLDMIENLLDSMKLRDGKLVLIKEDVNIIEVIETVLNKFSVELANIKVIKSFSEAFNINTDKKRLTQIVNNLMSNAIKYSDSTIAIVIKNNTKNFVLEILDDGKGFEDSDNAFKLFTQSDESNMTRTDSGTGVGLFVVRSLCDIMQYKIDIKESENLGGARIVIKGEMI